MRKYPPNEPVCGAIYDNASADNPLLAAMPEMLSPKEFMEAIRSMPGLPHNLPQMSPEERRQNLSLLSSVFIPMDYMYALYDQLYRAIRDTYTARSTTDATRRINALFCNQKSISFGSQAVSGSVLGVPGIGKTSTICHSLATMPQVIEHTQYMNLPFFCKQVLYLKVECPSDCSVKTLAFNLVAALDSAIGSDYLKQMTSFRSGAASSIATQMKILCMTHHVGLLLVDEIQNAAETASRNRQVKPLLKFLVELTNDTSTAVFFIGTPTVEQLFTSQEHLKRRTRGIRLLPLKPDGTYRRFLDQLWKYQFTQGAAPLSEKIANKLFDASGGIPAYIVKIFQETQAQALLQGQKRINEKIMQRAIDILAIKVPKTYSSGTYISDFELGIGTGEDSSEDMSNESGDEVAEVAMFPEPALPATSEKEAKLANSKKLLASISDDKDLTPVSRLYANQRGRKIVKRDDQDLVVAFQTGSDMIQFLQKHNLFGGVDNTMLTYFPTPYPNEWWYSVLCRYHVRSGRQDASETLRELYGKHPRLHARLFPRIDQCCIFRQVPNGTFDLKELLLNYTLLPYYLRFTPLKAKKKRMNDFLRGQKKGVQKVQMNTPEGKQGLKFCSMCYLEDMQTYGEPYWHRDHQIPLMSLCPKHKIRLHLIEVSFSELEEKFLPLYGIPNSQNTPQIDSSLPWEAPLSDALFSLLNMPFEVGPPRDYNNVELVLRSGSTTMPYIGKDGVLDIDKLRQYCFEFYGESIGEQYFKTMINFRWDLILPERYALLTVVAGITVEESFGPEIQIEDPLLQELLKYKNMGLEKKEIAKRMGISLAYTNILIEKYKIEPFWRSRFNNKRVTILLSPEEKQYIDAAAAQCGKENASAFAKEVLMQKSDDILRNLSCI